MFAAGYLAGIVCCDKAGLSMPFWTVLLICAAVLCMVCRSVRKNLLLLLLAFVLGGMRMCTAGLMNPPVQEKFSVCYSGTVVSEPALNDDKDRIICSLQLTELDGSPNRALLRLYLRSDILPLEGIEYGQRLDIFGHVWPQDPVTNPGQFDSVRWLLSDGITGMAAAKLEDVKVAPAPPSLTRCIIAVRNAISERIRLLFPHNSELVCALVLGDRSDLDVDIEESFRLTGITHLICISGMHVSVLASAVSWLLARFLRRRYALLATLAIVFLYGMLIGFPASLIRATVMFAVFSIAPLVGHPSDPVTRLSTALLGMLLFSPFSIYDGGFVLSFSASAGIILLTPALESLIGIDHFKGRRVHANPLMRLLRSLLVYFPQLFCATFAAQLATLPIIIAYFGGQSLISLPFNLIAIPLTMLAYPIALAALIGSFLLPLAQPAAIIADRLLSLLVSLARSCASLPIPNLSVPAYPPLLLLTHFILCVAASNITRTHLRVRRFLPLALLLLLPFSILHTWLSCWEFHVVFLDAGQADAAVIHTEGHTFMVDTGDEYSPASDYLAASALSLDAVFLSHPHYDHAAGLAELLDTMPPKVIYVPRGWFDVEADESVAQAIDRAQKMGITIIELTAGEVLTLTDHVSVRIHGPSEIPSEVNDLSLLLEMRYQDRSLFFTGDVSSDSAPENLPDADILKVPHHGSAGSSDIRFLQSLAPEIAIISVGDNNYGHPSQKTLDALESIGADVYRTDKCGSITAHIGRNGSIRIETYLSLEEYE